MSRKKITCGQCESGPDKATERVKCFWTHHSCGVGSKACAAYFESSVNSGLRCTKCSGPLEYYEVQDEETICSKCAKGELDRRQAQRERLLCKLAGWVIFATAVMWIVGVGLHRGWW